MKITCTGRKVTLKPAFTQRAEDKLAKLQKFFSDDAQAQVTVTVEKDRQTVEITGPSEPLCAWKTRWIPRWTC